MAAGGRCRYHIETAQAGPRLDPGLKLPGPGAHLAQLVCVRARRLGESVIRRAQGPRRGQEQFKYGDPGALRASALPYWVRGPFCSGGGAEQWTGRSMCDLRRH